MTHTGSVEIGITWLPTQTSFLKKPLWPKFSMQCFYPSAYEFLFFFLPNQTSKPNFVIAIFQARENSPLQQCAIKWSN